MSYPTGSNDTPLTQTQTQTRMRPNTQAPSHGSRTIVIESVEPAQDDQSPQPDNVEEIGILRLRGDLTARRPPAIRWDENVIDNEHMNKKKSKICCIYHKPHVVGESSESESDSDSSDDCSSSDDERCNHRRRPRQRNPRKVSPNAYERQPVYKNRPKPQAKHNH